MDGFELFCYPQLQKKPIQPLTSDNTMASILKRKRGNLEVADAPKRSKNSNVASSATPTAFSKQSGWDAAFPAPPKDLELVVANGVNGDDGPSSTVLDFETANNEEFQEVEEERMRRAQQHEQVQKALKKAIRRREQQAWKLSEPIGGRMINVDPVFTAEEKYVCINNVV